MPLIASLFFAALLLFPGESRGMESGVNERALDQYIRGTVADQMQDYYRAIFHYQEALRFDSSSAFINVALAQDYILLGNPDQASEHLDRALAINPQHAPALELKTLLQRGVGDIPGARETLMRLAQIAPENLDYQKQLLTLNLQLRKYDEADRIYERIAEAEDPTGFLARQVLAVYLAEQEQDRAIHYLERLIAKDSTDAALIYTLGAAFQFKGDTIRAEQYLRQANRMDPAEPRYWAGMATIELNRANFGAAVSLIDSSLARTSEPAPALWNLKGVALNRLGKKADAIVALQNALALDSNLVSALGILALIYDQLDSLDQVVDLYKRAISLSDSAAVYMNNLAYSYAQRGIELETALFLSTRALSKDPVNGSYLDTMGWVKFRMGEHREAVKWLKRAMRRAESNAEVYEHLGDVYRSLGSDSKARKYYLRALSKDPDNEELRRKAEH